MADHGRSTSVPPGTCLTHGPFAGAACPGCSTAVQAGPLLRGRLAWEAEHPRPESIRRAERAIVRALAAEGFGTQHQVTAHDRFEIAVDDLLIRVEVAP